MGTSYHKGLRGSLQISNSVILNQSPDKGLNNTKQQTKVWTKNEARVAPGEIT